MNHVDADAPDHEVERAGPETRRIAGVRRRGVPRRAGERARARCSSRCRSTCSMNWADDAAARDSPARRAAAARRRSARASSAPPSCCARRERPMFIVGTQLRWSPRRDAVRALADAVEAPFYLNGMARGALPYEHRGLLTRSRKFALAQADRRASSSARRSTSASTTAAPINAERQGRPGRSRRRASSGATAASTSAIDGDTGVVLEQLLARGGGRRARRDWLARGARRRGQAARQDAAEIESNDSPPNPLRVCAELGKRLGKNDIVIGDGGDFVATAAYVLKLEWPQLWMDPGPLGTLGVGPGYAMAAKLARPDANVVLVYGDGSFGLHALEFEAMVAPEDPGRRASSATTPAGRRSAAARSRSTASSAPSRPRSTTRATTRSSRRSAASAPTSRRAEELGPALDAAFACGEARVREREDRAERLPQGRDQRLSARDGAPLRHPRAREPRRARLRGARVHGVERRAAVARASRASATGGSRGGISRSRARAATSPARSARW